MAGSSRIGTGALGGLLLCLIAAAGQELAPLPKAFIDGTGPGWQALGSNDFVNVNGEEVSGGTGCQPANGYLCLESEGSPIQFRALRLRELP